MPHPRIPEAKMHLALEALANDAKLKDAAALGGMSVATLVRYAQGVPELRGRWRAKHLPQDGANKLPESQFRPTIAAYAQGMSLRKAAALIGVAPSTFFLCLRAGAARTTTKRRNAHPRRTRGDPGGYRTR
jgi:hypothetical protein